MSVRGNLRGSLHSGDLGLAMSTASIELSIEEADVIVNSYRAPGMTIVGGLGPGVIGVEFVVPPGEILAVIPHLTITAEVIARVQYFDVDVDAFEFLIEFWDAVEEEWTPAAPEGDVIGFLRFIAGTRTLSAY